MSADTRSDDGRLKVVLAWHMHQPQYRESTSGDYQLPWTYLHAIKDYVDMAAHLEAVPAARAVVNFAPLLLEQIADYARQIEEFQREAALVATVSQQQREHVPVCLDGIGTQIALRTHVVREELSHVYREVGGFHDATLRGITSLNSALVRTTSEPAKTSSCSNGW